MYLFGGDGPCSLLKGCSLVLAIDAHHLPLARSLPEEKRGLAENPLLDDLHAGLFRLLHVQLAAQRYQDTKRNQPGVVPGTQQQQQQQ